MSADDIRNRLEKYISAKDSSVDLKQGPIYDLMLQPIPDEIDLGAVNAAHLLSMYGRINDPSQITTTELEAIAKNLRVGRVGGSKATTDIKLVLASTPTASVTIPAGTALCTADFKYVFVTDYAVTVTPDNAYAFYNSKTGRYEVLVSATAQNTGSGYNLPIGKLTTMVKSLSTVQAVTNTVAASGGTDASDDVSFYNRIQTALNGMDPSSLSAYFNAIASRTSYRSFLLFVSAADRTKFKRRVVGNSYDVYVGEPSYATYVDEFSYTSGPKSFTLKTGPATAIQYVMVNGSALGTSDWTFTRDTSVEYAGSTAARNTVVISTPLSNADTVSIYYTVNKNCVDIQLALDAMSPQGVSFVVREMRQVPVTMVVSLSVTQVSPTLLDTATELLSNMVNGGQMDSISAFDVQEILVNSVPSVRSVSVTALRRKSSTASSVQTIALAFDEIATLDTTNGDLTVTAAT